MGEKEEMMLGLQLKENTLVKIRKRGGCCLIFLLRAGGVVLNEVEHWLLATADG